MSSVWSELRETQVRSQALVAEARVRLRQMQEARARRLALVEALADTVV